MIKVIDGVFVGIPSDIPTAKDTGFSILGVCKDPLHRKHARVTGAEKEGYITKSLPKEEPEYLWADRGTELYCNLIDAKDVKYIPKIVITRALQFLYGQRALGNRVLIVCNKAESRSPSIALMYMIGINTWSPELNFQEVLENFVTKYYPFYNPGGGMLEYTKRFWEDYQNVKKTEENL